MRRAAEGGVFAADGGGRWCLAVDVNDSALYLWGRMVFGLRALLGRMVFGLGGGGAEAEGAD